MDIDLHNLLVKGYSVEPMRGAGKSRYVVTAPGGQRQWMLGSRELTVANHLLSSSSASAGVLASIRAGGMPLSEEQVDRFRARLRHLGFFDPLSPDTTDPLSGALLPRRFRWICVVLIRRQALRWPVLCETRPWEQILLQFSSAGFVVACHMSLLAAPSDISGLLAHAKGLGWLFSFAGILASGVVHEGGHATACLISGIRVREVGLSLYAFAPMGWCAPHQSDFQRAPFRSRVFVIMSGPLASGVLAAIGLLCYTYSQPGGPMRAVGAYVVLSGWYGVVVTMMPFVRGDGQALVKEICEKYSGASTSQSNSQVLERYQMLTWVCLATLVLSSLIWAMYSRER